LPRFLALFVFLLVLTSPSCGAAQVETALVHAAPVPDQMRNSFFAVTVNSQQVDVAHAASNYQFASFDVTGPVDISITAADSHFWDSGVDIEPWRLGLRASRPEGEPQTIRFRLPGPAKLSISRPGDFLSHAQMLFFFAGTPPPPPPTGPNIHIVPAGVHRESLNPKSGDTLYLAPGGFVFGSLNLFNVQNIKVLGRGTIVYDGPQDPNSDDGLDAEARLALHRRCERSQHVEIDGLTCIVRSRTWSIQMKDSTWISLSTICVSSAVIQGNANQDGMDWLGGGNTIVRNRSFLRASDDVFAAFRATGTATPKTTMTRARCTTCENILIEHSELSTSISNIVRVATGPKRSYNSAQLHLCAIPTFFHAGIGACGQTFGLLGVLGRSRSPAVTTPASLSRIYFSTIGIRWCRWSRNNPGLHGFVFRNIWALDQPPLAASTLMGDVSRCDLR
jgi:hypothetical protein